MKIALTSIFVDNPTTAHTFYTEVLGFTTRLFVPEAMLAIVVSPEEQAGTGLLLEPNDNPISRSYQTALRGAQLPTIVFGVDDLDAEHARLTAHGVAFLRPPTRTEAGYEAIIDDTCGNYVQLFQA